MNPPSGHEIEHETVSSQLVGASQGSAIKNVGFHCLD